MFDRKDIKFVIILSFMIITFGGGIYAGGSTTTSGYSIDIVDVNAATEYRFFFNEHHFMTLVDEDGTLNFRPHPGVDVNGWGSSWYAQPFLAKAELGHTDINSVEEHETGISVDATGKVSKEVSSTYGTWSITMTFNYDQLEMIIAGNGVYSITLDGPLSSLTGDLNLYKIASNYLDDVPLLSGGTGDTGDMKHADVVGDNFSFTWIPPDEPSHFPTDTTDYLSIDVIGQYNNIDAVAQGYDWIDPAYKPSLKVMLTSLQAETQMSFGGFYTENEGQCYWCDNIGITPLIVTQSTRTDFQFDVEFESKVPDSDDDGIPDDEDNCPLVYPDEPPTIDSAYGTCVSELGASDLSVEATDPCGGNINYTWTPLNGGEIIGKGPYVQFDPPTGGLYFCPYQVELKIASDASGLETTQVVNVYIKNAGDADGNGIVNLMDKLLVRRHYGELEGDDNWDVRADVTCDGVVNLMDKLKVRQQYGQTDGCVCQ